MEDQALSQWDNQASMNFDDMKSDLQIPLTFKGRINLSDIIAATIGDDVRSCDTITNTEGAVPADENSIPCNYGDQLSSFGTNSNTEENAIATDSSNVYQDKLFFPSVFADDSNACDSFPNTGEHQFYAGPANDTRSSQGHFGIVPNHGNSNYSDAADSMFPTADQFTRPDDLNTPEPDQMVVLSFNSDTDFLLALCEEEKLANTNISESAATSNEQTTKFHIVPDAEIDLTADDESVDQDEPTDNKLQSTYPTFESDLEDSMHFVEGNDSLHDDSHDIKPEKEKAENNGRSRSKKRRLSEYNNNSLPVILEFKSMEYDAPVKFEPKPDLYNLMSSEHGIDELNTSFRVPFKTRTLVRHRSFSEAYNKNYVKNENSNSMSNCDTSNSELKTPTLKRSRSLSEACMREDVELSPMGDSRFNTSLSSLLGSPPPDSPLSNNPFFTALQSTLKLDCENNDMPKALFDTLVGGSNLDVYARERNLQSKFSSMQSAYPDEIRELSSFYRCQSAEVETERFRELHDENVPASYRNYLNNYYDEQLHKIMDRVEKSVNILSKAKKDSVITCQSFRPRPLLSRKAVRMMEEWYNRNFEHPYPGQVAVEALAKAGEITEEQVKKWYANKRNRCKNIRPMNDVINMKRKRQYSSRW